MLVIYFIIYPIWLSKNDCIFEDVDQGLLAMLMKAQSHTSKFIHANDAMRSFDSLGKLGLQGNLFQVVASTPWLP